MAAGPDGAAPGDTPWVGPDTRAFLDRLARDAAGAPAEPTLEQRRMGLGFAVQAYGPTPGAVSVAEDHVLNTSAGPVRARLYRPPPKDAVAAPSPLVIHLHGGGWALGDPDGYAPVVTALCAAAGCPILDVDYRRAPEHRYPAALDDARAALDWSVAHADALEIDPARIVLLGDSAGGHVAAGVSQTTPHSVALQVLLYPMTDSAPEADHFSRRRFGDGRFFLRESDITRAEAEYFRPDEDRSVAPASPLRAGAEVFARQPETWVVTAGLDPLRDEGEAYARRVAEAGRPCHLDRIEGTVHGFVLFAGHIAAGRTFIEAFGARMRDLAAA